MPKNIKMVENIKFAFSLFRKDVADTLIQIYLAFFKAAVKQKTIDNKLLSAILTGKFLIQQWSSFL